MFIVSIIGPDGVGKTTIVQRLRESLPLPVKYVYMGDNPASFNYVLPTMRWWKKLSGAGRNGAPTGPPAAGESSGLVHRPAARPWRNPLRAVRKSVGFVNRMLDIWYRYAVAAYFARRGYVVLLDRHFVFDYYHFDIAPQNGRRPFKRRLQGFLFKHTIPEPDLVICLDAPAEVIFARKGEFDVAYLERRRQQYRSLESVARHFALVNADQELERVVQDVRDVICNFQKEKEAHVEV